MNINDSKKIARLVGPVLVVMVASELRFWNPTLYAEQITPLVYLSGILLFTAGARHYPVSQCLETPWPVLLTLLGWAGVLLGLTRILFPQSYKAQFKNDNLTLIVEILLILIGLILTFQAYRRPSK